MPGESERAGHGRRVLVVEDDRHTRGINVLALRTDGYEVLEAVSAEEGIRAALSEKPDLIVMDLALPGTNGYQATERIKKEMAPEPPLIIVLTAHALRVDLDAARRAGCDAFLTKPIDPFDLVHEVERLLEGKEKRE